MNDIQSLENRYAELASKPKSKEEVVETLMLAKLIESERAKEYSGLISELFAIGIEINSIWDLVNTKLKYPKAIPILLKYLSLVRYNRNKEGIVRALTVPSSKKNCCTIFADEYLSLPKEKENLRWVIGNAVYVTITKNDGEKVIPVILNRENVSSSKCLSRL